VSGDSALSALTTGLGGGQAAAAVRLRPPLRVSSETMLTVMVDHRRQGVARPL
jgi:hypothetical protein